MSYPDLLPIECKFCKGDAFFRPLKEMEVLEVHVHFCDKCQAEYLRFNDGTIASVSLYTKINDHMYRWTVTSARTAQLWRVKDPGIPGTRVNRNLEPVMGFEIGDTIPEITPDNVEDKIRTWLVFL
jgi:hypothetical protein